MKPITVLLFVVAMTLAAAAAVAIVAWRTQDRALLAVATYVWGAGFALACLPLVAFLTMSALTKLRGRMDGRK